MTIQEIKDIFEDFNSLLLTYFPNIEWNINAAKKIRSEKEWMYDIDIAFGYLKESERILKEGEILTHDLRKSLSILNNDFGKYGLIFVSYTGNRFSISFNKKIEKQILEKLLTELNNLGYFIASISFENKGEEKKTIKYTKENLIKLLSSSTNIILKVDSKFDKIEREIPVKLYHITPTKNVQKILTKGLIPASKNNKYNFPSRTYVVVYRKEAISTAQMFYDMQIQYYNENKIKEQDICLNYTILEIDSRNLSTNNFKLYKDPNMPGVPAFYVLNTIDPKLISINSTITFSFKNGKK